MEWMIDTANLEEIREAMDMLPITGVTTNPSILKAALPFDANGSIWSYILLYREKNHI